MAIEKVKEFFAQFGREADVLEFEVSSATVELAAIALGVEGKRIAKTMSFAKDDTCILVVAAGDARVDNAKFKHTFGMKARMLAFDDVEPLVGHPVGGVCPFAIREGVKVYLDESLRRFDTVFPACGSGSGSGSSNSAIELTCAELEKYACAKAWVDVCKNWE